MKLKEAIEILEKNLQHRDPHRLEGLVAASRLGREALKAWAQKRQGMPHSALWLLPGETEE